MPRAAVLIWLCFLARGAFYCVALPLWEGFDEYAHFARVQHVAAGRWLATPTDRATREVERSIELSPMPWTTRSDPPPHETYESYWKLPAGERARRKWELAALRSALASTDAITAVPAESQQPPLSYWLMAAFYKPLQGVGLPARVLALRLLNLLLTSVAVPAAWIAARRVFANDRMSLAVAGLVALFPEMMFDGARVTNSALSIALFSVMAVLCLQVVDGKRRAELPLGVVLGLGLLTKGFFLPAVPVVVALLAWRHAKLPLILAAAIPGWWYLWSLRITGSFSPILQDTALKDVSLLYRLRQIPRVNWSAALDSTFFSHIWFGGWSFLQVRSWMYHLFALIAIIAAAGLAVAWLRRLPARRYIAVLASIYLLFCAGLAYHVLATYLANGISSSAGWYLCAVIVPEILLAAAGLRALFGVRLVGVLTIAFALLDIYGMLFVALPYYTGLTGHRPNGFLESFHFGRLFDVGILEVLRRIASNPGVAAILLCAYIVSTAAVVRIVFKPSSTHKEFGFRG